MNQCFVRIIARRGVRPVLFGVLASDATSALEQARQMFRAHYGHENWMESNLNDVENAATTTWPVGRAIMAKGAWQEGMYQDRFLSQLLQR